VRASLIASPEILQHALGQHVVNGSDLGDDDAGVGRLLERPLGTTRLRDRRGIGRLQRRRQVGVVAPVRLPRGSCDRSRRLLGWLAWQPECRTCGHDHAGAGFDGPLRPPREPPIPA
jgi:hypothetical protein